MTRAAKMLPFSPRTVKLLTTVTDAWRSVRSQPNPRETPQSFSVTPTWPHPQASKHPREGGRQHAHHSKVAAGTAPNLPSSKCPYLPAFPYRLSLAHSAHFVAHSAFPPHYLVYSSCFKNSRPPFPLPFHLWPVDHVNLQYVTFCL